MQDLATIDDVEDRLGRSLTDEETARAPALLKDASAKVRNHTGQTLSAVSGDVLILRPVGSLLRLPQRPVTAVTSVSAIGPNGSVIGALSGWSWDGRDKIDLTYAQPAGSWPLTSPSQLPDTYQVLYDHGYATMPDIVVATVCAMVMRTLLSPSMTPGMVAERIGSYNYQLQQGSGATGASLVMTDEDKRDLRRYGPRTAGTIQVEAG